MPLISNAQSDLEMSTVVAGTGPVLTTTQTLTENTNNPSGNTFAAFTPTQTVTFTFSNQQYTGSGSATNGDLEIGANGGGGANINQLMNVFNPGANSSYTSNSGVTAGTGIDVASNSCVEMTNIVSRLNGTVSLVGTSLAAPSITYMGDLTISFNHPVNNPHLHFSGIGGGGISGLYFYTAFSLKSSNTPVTVSKISGTSFFNVASDSIYSTDPNTGGASTAGTAEITGTGIRTVTFKVYTIGWITTVGDTWLTNNSNNNDAFTLGVSIDKSASLSLPIKFIAATASKISVTETQINWNVEEENVNHYEIENSNDGQDFYTITNVQSKGIGKNSYTQTINDNHLNSSFYRIKEIDYNGQITYSSVLKVIDLDNVKIAFSPNPANDIVNVQIGGSYLNQKTIISLINLMGQEVYKKEIAQAHANEILEVSNLVNGLYQIKIQGLNSEILNSKVFIAH